MNQVRDIATNQTKSKYFKTAFKLTVNNPDIKFSDVKIWLEREGQVIANAVINKEEISVYLFCLKTKQRRLCYTQIKIKMM